MPVRSAARVAAPSAPSPVCGQPVLNSPYGYTGSAGAYTSGTAGLPTFGSAGTDFPAATAGLVVAAGDNTADAGPNALYQADHTVVYFEPGTHTLKQGMYTGTGTAYVGGYTSAAGKAVLDGAGTAGLDGADAQNADETWKYLTVQNFGSDRDSTVLGNVNGAAFSSGNTYQYDTIGPDEYNSSGGSGQDNGGGYGIAFYSNTTIDHDCLTQDSQGAFNGSSGINNKITNNEISKNGLGEYPDSGNNPQACGCSAGGKVLDNLNTDVTGNYVHDNYNTGIWADFDNSGLDISGNYVSANWGAGIAIEASYNSNITGNTLVGNGWGSNGPFPSTSYSCYGPTSCTNGLGPVTGGGGGNPYAALELDNSGGNANLNAVTIPGSVPVAGCSSNCVVNSRFSGQMNVQANVLTDNFGGVQVYTDTDRYPGNIDNDSSCSVPLGVGATDQQPNSPTYYRQTSMLQTTSSDASVSGTSVSTTGGTITICADYGAAQPAGPADQGGAAQAPSAGMAVFNMDTGTFLGNVASVSSNKSFTLDRSPGNATGFRLYVSGYGGCGMADYFGGNLNVASGNPSANYWDNCIWGSRNETISGNTFTTNSGSITGCTAANLCGVMGAVAFNAGVPQLMQVFDNYSNTTAKAAGGLGNVWSGNTYNWSGSGGSGGWQMEAGTQGTLISQADWLNIWGQDAGSTFNGSTPSPTPTSPSPTPTSPSPTPTSPSPTGTGGLAYDATGPSPSGKTCAGCATLSWSHTVSGANTALLVGVAAGKNSDAALHTAATYGGTPMTLLKTVHDDNKPDGYLDVFGLAGVPAGTASVTVTVTGGTAAELTGGSESFTGAAQSGTFGTAASAYGYTATPKITTGVGHAGDIVAGFAASGSSIRSATAPSTSRYIANRDGDTGAGNSAGATSPSTGSPVTMSWAGANDYWGAVAVEVAAAA